MSHQNKLLLTQANAAIVKGDHEGFLAHCTDEVVWIFVGDQTLTGKEAVRRYMKQTYTQPPRFTVEQMIADDEFVTALGHIALANGGGHDVHYEYCDVWRVRGGKLAELRAYVVALSRVHMYACGPCEGRGESERVESRRTLDSPHG